MSDASLGRSGSACVNKGSHSSTYHPHVRPKVEWVISAFTPQPQSVTALWLVLISRSTDDRRLSWPESWDMDIRLVKSCLTHPDSQLLGGLAELRVTAGTRPIKQKSEVVRVTSWQYSLW